MNGLRAVPAVALLHALGLVAIVAACRGREPAPPPAASAAPARVVDRGSAASPPDAEPAVASPRPATGFAGRWAGPCSITIKCGAEPQSVDQDEVDITVVGDGRALAVTRDGCTWRFDVRGRTAAMRAGQRCVRDAGAAATGADESIESWTLALQPGDQALTTTVRSRIPAGDGTSCSAQRRGVLSRP